MVSDLWYPLVRDVRIRAGTDDAEADKEHVGLRIGQWSQTVIIFLAGRVPQSKAYCYVVNNHRRCVVVKSLKEVIKQNLECYFEVLNARIDLKERNKEQRLV